MGTHKIYSGIQGLRDNISGSLYGDCHELLARHSSQSSVNLCPPYFEFSIKTAYLAARLLLSCAHDLPREGGKDFTGHF